MAKILTDVEMSDIVVNACTKPEIVDCADSYKHFLEDLAILITNHFGGDVGNVNYDPTDTLGWICSFYANETLPNNGGIFKNYDTDVVWKNGKEED